MENRRGRQRSSLPIAPVKSSDEGSTHLLYLNPLIEKLYNIGRDIRGGKQSKLKIDEKDLLALCYAGTRMFMDQPMILEVQPPLVVAGDIHGQFTDLLRVFKLGGGLPPEKNYLFLGDYVDRGKHSIETISLLIALKLKYPNSLALLRGNHECASINRIYGFYDECKRRYSIKLWKEFSNLFNAMPVAAIVEDRIFCCHGGLSPELKTLDQIALISRPTDVADSGLLCDLLWSDPDKETTGWGKNDRGVSFTFGKDVVSEFLKENNLDLICRAHQVVEEGYEFFANRRLVTLFTASNYCGEFDNCGGLMIIKKDLLCSFKVLKPLKTVTEGEPKSSSVSMATATKKKY